MALQESNEDVFGEARGLAFSTLYAVVLPVVCYAGGRATVVGFTQL